MWSDITLSPIKQNESLSKRMKILLSIITVSLIIVGLGLLSSCDQVESFSACDYYDQLNVTIINNTIEATKCSSFRNDNIIMNNCYNTYVYGIGRTPNNFEMICKIQVNIKGDNKTEIYNDAINLYPIESNIIVYYDIDNIKNICYINNPNGNNHTGITLCIFGFLSIVIYNCFNCDKLYNK